MLNGSFKIVTFMIIVFLFDYCNHYILYQKVLIDTLKIIKTFYFRHSK